MLAGTRKARPLPDCRPASWCSRFRLVKAGAEEAGDDDTGEEYGVQHGQPPNEGRAGRRSPGRTRFTGVLLILLSLMSAAACHWVFVRWLPSDGERYRDYRAAEPCSSRAMERG
ncbi:hypothetical protein GCM10023238_14140 [Streptomyces heliomycini]